MLKLQPDSKPIKLKLQVNHYKEVLRLLYLSLVLKLADATFNFGTVLIFLSKVIIGLESSIIIGFIIASTSEYKLPL
jgi:hypothetical protein